MMLRFLQRVMSFRRARFTGDESGLSAVEFALVAPLMLILYLGGVEVSQAISAARKTTLVAHTIGDLVAQSTSVSNADIANIFSAGSAVLYPFDTTQLQMIISGVEIDQNGTATVQWSDTSPASVAKRSGNVTTLIPSALRVPNTWLIWAEATYSYRPQIGYVLTGTLALRDQTFLRPRQSTSVARTQ